MRNMLVGVSLLAAAVLVAAQPSEETAVASAPSTAAAPTLIDDAGPVVLADGGARSDPGGNAGTRSPGPLRGLTGAAAALAIGDATLSLSLLADVAPGDEGSETWFTVGALRGRAHRLAGQYAESVDSLEALALQRRVSDHFPRELLGLELAQARIAYAASGTLPVADADAQRRKAIDELAKARKLEPNRNFSRMRVLQATAMAELEGTSPHATKVAAAKAVKALHTIIGEYPHHPDVGTHRLMHARALERAGKGEDAADALRKIAIGRAGEPEADEAWAELKRLAAKDRSVRLRPLLITERLDQAVNARGLRRVELSRKILDEIIAEPATPEFLRTQAMHSRAWTAYKQRDFKQCVDDLRPAYEATGNRELRDRMLKCLERGEMYDEAIAMELEGTKTKKRGLKANAYWEALQQAFRAGRYKETEELLEKYEAISKGNRAERTWLAAWLAYRQGRAGEAIDLFAEVPRRSPKDATRARYFRGKLMLASRDPATKAAGITALRQLSVSQSWDYYGLMARQRLLDAKEDPGPLPELEPIADEDDQPTRAETTTLLRKLDEDYGEAWPPIRRMKQLYAAGYLEEARRELRVATAAFQGSHSKSRSEALQEGLGWRSNWKFPRVLPTKLGRKSLRDRTAKTEISAGLRALSLALDEPHGWAQLVPSSAGSRRARWHPRAFRAPIEREARMRSIDPIHLWSLMYTESRFRRHVVSHVGARGALQIMPWTGRQLAERLGEIPEGRFDSDTLFDIDTNSHLAAYYIAELLAKFHGQGPMAYASYNGGPSNVERWLRAKAKGGAELELDAFIEEMVFTESYRYAKRVMEVTAAYSMLYKKDLPRWSNKVDATIEDNISF